MTKTKRPTTTTTEINPRRWPLLLLLLLLFLWLLRRHQSLGPSSSSLLSSIDDTGDTECCQPKLTDHQQLLPAQSLVRLLPVAIVVTPAVSSSPSECCPSLSLSSPLSYSGLRYAAAVSSPQFPRPPSSLTEPSRDDHEYFDGPTDDRARTTTTSSGVITHKRQRAAFLSIFMAIIKERMGRSTIVMVHTDFVDGLHQTVATVADRANIEAPAVKTRQSLSAFSHTTSSSPMLTLPIVNLVVPRRFLSIGIVFNGLHKKTGNTTVQCCHCCGWLLSKGIVVGALML